MATTITATTMAIADVAPPEVLTEGAADWMVDTDTSGIVVVVRAVADAVLDVVVDGSRI